MSTTTPAAPSAAPATPGGTREGTTNQPGGTIADPLFGKGIQVQL